MIFIIKELRAPLKIHFFEVKIRFIEFCSINA